MLIKTFVLYGSLLVGPTNQQSVDLPSILANDQNDFDLTEWVRIHQDLTLTSDDKTIKMIGTLKEEQFIDLKQIGLGEPVPEEENKEDTIFEGQ